MYADDVSSRAWAGSVCGGAGRGRAHSDYSRLIWRGDESSAGGEGRVRVWRGVCVVSAVVLVFMRVR